MRKFAAQSVFTPQLGRKQTGAASEEAAPAARSSQRSANMRPVGPDMRYGVIRVKLPVEDLPVLERAFPLPPAAVLTVSVIVVVCSPRPVPFP